MSFGPKNPAEAIAFAEENLLVDFQHTLHRVLQLNGWTQRDFAAHVGMNEAQVSQLFSARANPTIKTIAKLFHALGDECIVTSRRLEQQGGREHLAVEWQVRVEPTAPISTVEVTSAHLAAAAAAAPPGADYRASLPPPIDGNGAPLAA